MSEGSCEGDDSVLTDFLEAYLADRKRGVARTLDDYLLQFPGHARVIAREFLSLEEGDAFAKESRADIRGDSAPPGIEIAGVAGDRIGHYRVLDEIGRGGQGIVYLAEDTRLNRRVALKVLKGIGSLSEDSLARFRREAQAASRLAHAGICAVYEAALDGNVPYIAMRLVEGESLAAKIASAKSRGEAPADFVQLLEKVARALHAAHEAGVVHRDMKPGNVMVTPEGEAVIMDFGLAYLEDDRLPTLTQTGEFFGTPAYMSPEQLLAQRIHVDRRTDVWSLGVMLYECVTLQRPFESPTREGLYQAIQTREPPDAHHINPAVPKEMAVVIETALEKDRDRRYQTALDFAEELRRVRCFEPIRAKPAGPILRFRRWAQRNPVVATAVGGVFAALSVGLAVALFLLGKVTSERNEKQAALFDYDRLGDLPRLQRLELEADKLWPCDPSKVAALRAWVEQGADLERRLPLHMEVRDRLRASPSVLPYTDEDRKVDLRAHAGDEEQLAKLRQERNQFAQEVLARSRAASGPAAPRAASTSRPSSRPFSRPSLEDLSASIAKLDTEIAHLDVRVHQRETWHFPTTAEKFKHDTTAKLVADLMAFVDPAPPRGLLADVRARLAFAESVERETIARYESRWVKAIQSIGDKSECPKYGGLRIERQIGLIPIGKDPASGLWEFAHLQTAMPGTDPPERGQDGRLIVTEGMGIVFVLLPGGTFMMGAVNEATPTSESNVDPEAGPSEGPVMEVPLDAFFLSKYEMTQGQWLRLVGKNPSYLRPGWNSSEEICLLNPVEQVSWEDCDQWLGRLGLVIPTEAQWEYAARGGTTTPRWTGIGTEGLDKAANLADRFFHDNGGNTSLKCEPWNDGFGGHAPVGSFTANGFGLHDVLGNVGEWCRDCYAAYGVNGRKPGPGDGMSRVVAQDRVVRGGDYAQGADFARSSLRLKFLPGGRSGNIGIRPARPCRQH